MLLAMFLSALDQTVVATAGPEIQRSLHIEAGLYAWMTTAYLVASTVLVPVYGKLSDLFGRKPIILIGVGIFLLGSVLCGVSQSSTQLILSRAVQGAGSASIFTTAFAVIADLFPPSERGKYTGVFGAMFGVSSLVGPLLGGFITDTFGWHWVFFINLPLGALALGFIALKMPALAPRRVGKGLLDLPGAVLLALGVVPLLLGLSFGRAVLRPGDRGWLWTSWEILGLFAVAAVGLIAFIAWERRAKDPLIDLTLFQNRAFAWGNATMFVLGAVFLAPMVFLPLFMVNVVGISNTASGLTISPLVLGIVAGNVISGQLASRLGKYKALMLGAMVLLTIGFAVLGFTLTPASTQAEVTAKMVLLGLGLGPSIPLYTIAIQNAVRLDQLGVATSTTTFFRQMGSTVGLAVAGTLFATTLAGRLDASMPEATKGVPPQLVARFSQQPAGAGDAEGGPSGMERLDEGKIKARIHEELEGARAVAKKALWGDALAATLVETSPLATPELKAAAAAGGVRALVHAEGESLWKRLEAAAASDEAWTALSQQPDAAVWPEVHAALWPGHRTGTAEPGPAPVARQALAAFQPTFEQLVDRRGDLALDAAQAKLDDALTRAEARLTGAVDRVAAAMKQAFTDAISVVYRAAILLTLLALLLSSRIPQLPLRTSWADAPPAAE